MGLKKLNRLLNESIKIYNEDVELTRLGELSKDLIETLNILRDCDDYNDEYGYDDDDDDNDDDLMDDDHDDYLMDDDHDDVDDGDGDGDDDSIYKTIGDLIDELIDELKRLKKP